MLKGLKSLFSRNSQPSQSQNAQRVPQRIQFFNEDPSQQQAQTQAEQPPAAQPPATNPTNYTAGAQAPLPGAVPASQPPAAFRPTSAGSTGTSNVAAASSIGSEGPAPPISSEPSSVGPSSLATTPVPSGGFDASARAKLRSAPPTRTATVVSAGGLPGSSAPRAQSASVSRPTRLVQPTSDALYGGRRNEDAPLASSAFPFQKKGTTPVVTAMPSGGAVFQQGAHSRVVPDPFDA